MQKVENKQYSFYELLNIVGVKIPIIQRDYAQGREKAKDIRDRFLNRLFEVLNDNKTINLDFVYGTVKKKFLIPLDGQQRLTTLFLLHYYLGLKESKNIEFLQKFTYDIRLSSREFCNLLIEKKVYPKEIKNQTWFFSEWENDPTIKSMLVMLDSIEEKFKNCDNCFHNLNNITFSFLNLEDFKLTDELYIKMNARGKPLTTFENFKAEFEKFIKDETTKAKLDNEWLDIFWKLKENDNLKSVDDKYLNFFRNITLFFTDKKPEDVDAFRFEYRENNINDITKILDNLIGFEDKQIYFLREYGTFKINIFKDFIKEKPTYSERIRFHALMQFFIKVGDLSDKQKAFESYMRVCINLIQNMVDSFDEFKKMIQIIDKLSNYLKDDFYKKLSTSTISKSEQFKEERLKAELICKNQDYEKEFIQAEQHWYLDGQIGFLIEYAKNDFDKFNEYRDKFMVLWDFERENENNKFLVYRALLTFGNYLPKSGKSNHTFCSFDDSLSKKNENWRRVFNDSQKGLFLKDLLDTFDEINIKSSLETFINCWENDYKCEDADGEKRYLYTLISNEENIKYSTHFQIRFHSYDEIFLLKMTTIGGTHNELYSYHLYLNYLKDEAFLPFENSNYYSTRSWERPCAFIDKFEYKENNFAIDILYKEERFIVKFFDRNKKEIPQKIINILDNNGFEKNSDYCKEEDTCYLYNENFSLCEMKELFESIKEFANNLNILKGKK